MNLSTSARAPSTSSRRPRQVSSTWRAACSTDLHVGDVEERFDFADDFVEARYLYVDLVVDDEGSARDRDVPAPGRRPNNIDDFDAFGDGHDARP